MAIDELKAFLKELKNNKKLFNSIRAVATANEIADIASEFGYQFTGNELKSFAHESVDGVKIKKQDTSPSYSFGENGIDPNENCYNNCN